MKDLLSHIVEGILGEKVEIEEVNDNDFIVYKLSIPKENVGIIIGKGGKTINAIKNVLKIRAIRENVRVDVEVNEA